MAPPIFYIFTFATPRDWVLYGIGALFAIIAGLAFPGLDFVYGIWLQAQAVPDPQPGHILYVARITALACLGMGIGQAIGCFAFLSCFSIASGRLATRLRHAYVQSIVHQDAKFFEDVGAGEVATRIVKDIGAIETAAGQKIGFVIWGLSTLVAALIVAFVRAPRLAGVLTCLIPISAIFMALVSSPGEKINARIVKKDGHANTFLEQILSSIRIVQAFAAENVLIRKYDKHLEGLEKDGTKRALVKGGEVCVTYLTLYLVYSTAIWFGGIEVTKRGLPVAAFFTAFWNFFNALFAIGNMLPHIISIVEASSAQVHIREAIHRKPLIDVRSQEGTIPPSTSGWNTSIELRNVTFAYPSRPDFNSLDGVSFSMEAEKVTAIVGPSGSGKSTVAGLLTRWWDLKDADDKGNQLLIGGTDIKEYNLRWLRSQISTVSQDPQLFTATIFENVAHGLTGTPHEYNLYETEENGKLAKTRMLVQEALEKAQAWTFVSALPQGMDTKISGAQVGVLSGGQRQRIATARALVRRPRILVLDEGTSALDAEVERKLMESIYSEQKEYGMTTILIAHRLSTIQLADNIVVMDEGRVVEQGTYVGLLEQNGVFASLVAKQMASSHHAAGTVPDSSGDRTEKPEDAEIARFMQEKLESDSSTVSDATLEEGHVPDATSKAVKGPALRTWAPRYFDYLSKQWRWFGGGSLAAVALGATFPVAAYLIGLTATTFSIPRDEGARLRHEANRWSVVFLGIAGSVVFSAAAAGFLLEGAAERVGRRLRLASLRAIVKQEVAFFDKDLNASGSLTATVATYGANASGVLGLIWLEIFACIINLVGAVVLAFALSWKISLIAFIPIPLSLLAGYLNVVQLERYEALQKSPVESASAYVGENVANIRTVVALGRESAVLERFKKQSYTQSPRRTQLYLGGLGLGLGMGMLQLVSAIIMAWGTRLYAHKEVNLTTLAASQEAVILAGWAANRGFSFIPDISRAVHAFKRITAWELRQPAIARLPLPPNLVRPHTVVGDIQFKGCTMYYRGQMRPAIRDLNLHIQAGQNVAFCGPSGSGKSTILALLNRFYDPYQGSVEVDGFDVRALPLDEYRSNLGLVSQDAVLYDGSFRENITLGMPREVSDEELEGVCRQARILDFIQSLPDGFDCNVGLKGAQMSGGQRQRVCIARALLRNPKILLLDEATSALDVESERYIQEALEEASVGRTTISVAHRLSTIRNADVIYVVEDGTVVEWGNHAELLDRRGRYFDLVKGQL